MVAIDDSIPLKRFNRFASSSIEEVRGLVADSYCPHGLELASRNSYLEASYNSFQLSNISLNFLSYGSDVEITPGVFKGFYMLEFPLSGSVDLEYGHSKYKTQSGLGTIISPIEPVRSRWSANCKQVMVKVDRSVIEQYLMKHAGIHLNAPLEFNPLINFDVENGKLIKDFILMLLGQADQCPGLISDKQLSSEFERILLGLILNNIDHNYSSRLLNDHRVIVPKSVKRVQAYIEENFSEQLTLENIVEAAGCSERALYSAFKQFLGVTPLCYLKNIRFEKVRQSLKNSDGCKKVSEIAFVCGFTHMGRFSSEYIKRYGERPSDTLKLF